MRIGILGTGLIGASIGLGLQEVGHDVIGWDADPAALAAAAERQAVREAAAREEVLDAEVVVLALPPEIVIRHVAELRTDALVMDVAGVKQPVAAACRLKRYVGTHPMAGREVSGPGAATASLFRGAAWVVVPGSAGPADVAVVERLIDGSLGARPVRMSAESHDVAVAAISHLPQLLASTLMNEAADRTDAMELVAGSFRDLTRVAASDPATWVEVLAANRAPLLEVLEEFLARLRALTDAVARDDRTEVSAVLARAQQERRTLGPQTVGVRIALADQPGELARVGRAFERAGVDVRDLQLRHAPYGGGGVLTVSVRSGDEATMRSAVEAEGLLLAE